MSRTWVYLCFFLSGFSGLVNEVVWSRLFVYTMGSSHLSIAVVISVFMGGLALGSLFGGPIADRSPSPLRLYGLLVLLAGLASGAVAPLLWLAEPLLRLAYRLHDGEPSHPIFTLAKALVSAAAILVPTTLMGATLPALARHLTRSPAQVGASLGTLYAVNTFGAVAGTVAAGFFLVGNIGLGWTIALGAAVDILVGAAVVLRMARRSRDMATAFPRTPGKVPAAPKPAAVEQTPAASLNVSPGLLWAVRTAVVAFGVSGFVNMCLQLGWTRALIISIGNSTYAFSVIVGIFIFGLAAGGWIAGLFTDRLKNPISAFGWLLVITAAAAGATIPWLGLSPARFAWDLGQMTLPGRGGFTFAGFLWTGAGGVALVILPSTILMGMGFPIVGRIRTLVEAGVGRAVGAAYASNTIGAILGTALTGFVLVPLLGSIWKLLYIAVGLGFAAGSVVLVAAPGPRRTSRLAILALVTITGLGAAWLTRPYGALDGVGASGGKIAASSATDTRTRWHPVLFSMGAYRSFPIARDFSSPEEYTGEMLRTWEPLYYSDGEVASVSVLRNRDSGHLVMNISGKPDASAGGEFTTDLQTQLLLGYLPLLVHPAPGETLCLGLGGGMTLGAMTAHPAVDTVDLLELSPEVEEAARLHFAGANKGALSNPKVRKVIGDGRNHLTHTRRTYDVISSEPSNFWIAGLGNLFTEEFYTIVKDRLKPGGILCQWIYGYNIRLADYQVALRTILRVFPQATIWTNHFGDTLILAAREPMTLDRARIASALQTSAIRDDLEWIGIRAPEDLFRYFQGEGGSIRTWVGEGPLNKDFFPVLEFSSPLGFFAAENLDIPALLAAASPGALPRELFRGFDETGLQTAETRRNQGRALTRLLRQTSGTKSFARILEEYGNVVKECDPWTVDCASRELVKLSLQPKAPSFMAKAREIHDTPELCVTDGFRPLAGRSTADRIAHYRKTVLDAPANRWEPYFSLASIEAMAGMGQDALKTLETARARHTPAYKTAFVSGVIQGMQGNLVEAERSLREALQAAPPRALRDKGEISFNLGFALENQGRLSDAVASFQECGRFTGDRARSGIAIARCLRKSGDLKGASTAIEEVLRLETMAARPTGESRAETARIRTAQGRIAEALPLMQEAVRIAPGLYDKELQDLQAPSQR